MKAQSQEKFSEDIRGFNTYSDRPKSDDPYNQENVEEFFGGQYYLKNYKGEITSSDKDLLYDYIEKLRISPGRAS